MTLMRTRGAGFKYEFNAIERQRARRACTDVFENTVSRQAENLRSMFALYLPLLTKIFASLSRRNARRSYEH